MAQHDMVVDLRASAAIADKEGLAGQIGPCDSRLFGEAVPIRQHRHQRFGPDRASMAVGQIGRAGDKRHVQPVGAKLHDRIAGRAFGHLDLDAGMVFPVLRDQIGKEAAGDQGMDADAQATTFPRRCHAGSFHRMVELIDAGSDALNELASRLGQPDTARMTLEQQDAKVFLQRLHARAHAGLRHA